MILCLQKPRKISFDSHYIMETILYDFSDIRTLDYSCTEALRPSGGIVFKKRKENLRNG